MFLIFNFICTTCVPNYNQTMLSSHTVIFLRVQQISRIIYHPRNNRSENQTPILSSMIFIITMLMRYF